MNTIIPIEIYQTCIDLRLVKSVSRCMRGIMKKRGCKYNLKGESHGMVWKYDTDMYFLLYDINNMTHGLVSHEIEHIRAYIAEHAGSCEIDSTYLVQLITNKVYAFLEDNGVVVTSGM